MRYIIFFIFALCLLSILCIGQGFLFILIEVGLYVYSMIKYLGDSTDTTPIMYMNLLFCGRIKSFDDFMFSDVCYIFYVCGVRDVCYVCDICDVCDVSRKMNCLCPTINLKINISVLRPRNHFFSSSVYVLAIFSMFTILFRRKLFKLAALSTDSNTE